MLSVGLQKITKFFKTRVKEDLKNFMKFWIGISKFQFNVSFLSFWLQIRSLRISVNRFKCKSLFGRINSKSEAKLKFSKTEQKGYTLITGAWSSDSVNGYEWAQLLFAFNKPKVTTILNRRAKAQGWIMTNALLVRLAAEILRDVGAR